MTEKECLERMIAPGQRRPCKPYREGVIQIWVTRVCNLSCYGCTQGGNILPNAHQQFITLDQFRKACETLTDYFGVVGLIGGNPCMHPQFPELCRVLRSIIPKERCGLWANRLFGHGAVCRKTFNPNYSNLNVHLDRSAYDEIKRDWPEALPFGLNTDSRHSPPFVALQDLIEDEGDRWKLISECDVNHRWSAMIGVFRGELRAWFCEIAASQSILHQHEEGYPDTGLPVEEGWWKRPMSDFAHQVRFHCHACGVPLKGRGELSRAEDGVEQTTRTHLTAIRPKQRERIVQIVRTISDLGGELPTFTDYLSNSRR